jgi:hypothetical protein
MENARVCWEVVAGLLPGRDPEPEFTKQWWMTSSEVEAANAPDIWAERQAAAMEYARSLQNPNDLNWVRVDWIWF